MKVFVGYATVHGSTRQVADRIRARLLEQGFAVEIAPIELIAPDFDAYVLGSAVHNRAWLPEAASCLEKNAAALAGHRVWLFSVGMAAAMRGPWQRFGRREEPLLAASLERIVRSTDHRLFGGVFMPEHTSRAGRLMFRAMGLRFGDYRDPSAVDAWADQIVHTLLGIPSTQA